MSNAKDSFMMEPKSSTSSTQHHRTLFMVQNILRILAVVLLVASIIVTVTNNQTISLFSIKFEARFYYSSAFKCGMCLVSADIDKINLVLRQQASQRKYYYFFLYLNDMVVTLLVIAGCAAATAVGYVGQFGENHLGWEPICDHVRKFCRTNLVSQF